MEPPLLLLMKWYFLKVNSMVDTMSGAVYVLPI